MYNMRLHNIQHAAAYYVQHEATYIHTTLHKR